MSDEMHGYTPVDAIEGWESEIDPESGDVTDLYPVRGEINTWEQINGWSLIELVESLGITFTDACSIKVFRKCMYLPPVDTATGWLNHEHFFGWETYVEKVNYIGDGTSAASNSPQETEGYPLWKAWYYTEDGGGARMTVGTEQYCVFYDYHDRIYGIPGGYDGTFSPGMVQDKNQLLAYNRVDPQGGAPGTAHGYWPSHPYVDWATTTSANHDSPYGRNAYGSDPGGTLWGEYFNPQIMIERDDPDYGIYLDKFTDSYGPGLSYLSDDTYDESTTFISVYYYSYSDLKANIYKRYKAIEHTKMKFDLLMESATTILDSMKLSASSKWSMQRQNTTSIPKNLLSAVFSSGTPMAETYLDDEATSITSTSASPGDMVTTSFAYDTEESGEGSVGDDDY